MPLKRVQKLTLPAVHVFTVWSQNSQRRYRHSLNCYMHDFLQAFLSASTVKRNRFVLFRHMLYLFVVYVLYIKQALRCKNCSASNYLQTYFTYRKMRARFLFSWFYYDFQIINCNAVTWFFNRYEFLSCASFWESLIEFSDADILQQCLQLSFNTTWVIQQYSQFIVITLQQFHCCAIIRHCLGQMRDGLFETHVKSSNSDHNEQLRSAAISSKHNLDLCRRLSSVFTLRTPQMNPTNVSTSSYRQYRWLLQENSLFFLLSFAQDILRAIWASEIRHSDVKIIIAGINLGRVLCRHDAILV